MKRVKGASSLPLDARSRNSFRPGLPEAFVIHAQGFRGLTSG